MPMLDRICIVFLIVIIFRYVIVIIYCHGLHSNLESKSETVDTVVIIFAQ